MTLEITIPQQLSLLKPKISVFGVGGAGGNALNNMIKSNLEGVEFIAANTDAQALSSSLAANRIQLGTNLTKGLGAGSFPDRGRAAAEENIDEIIKYLEDNNMIFITAGMGGGTGTGAAPVIARLAKERNILTVGVVTKPFHFEGAYRMEAAETGIEELKKYVDTLIVIPNQNLFRIANEQTTFEQAFKMADNVLHAGVRSITDLITMPGLVNLDFADIETIMNKSGRAMMGTGEAQGENRAINACQEAVSNPLLDDVSIKGAKGVLVNMTGGPDMTLFEVDAVVNNIKKEVDQNANIIFGSAFNEDMKGKIRISIVATGIESAEENSATIKNTSKNKEVTTEIKNSAGVVRIDVVATDNIQDKKTFFDPGIAREPEQNLEKTPMSDFKNYKNVDIREVIREDLLVINQVNDLGEDFNRNANFSSNHFADNNFTKQDTARQNTTKIEALINYNNLFANQDEANKNSNKEEKLPKKKTKVKARKEGGFGLFNFMNSKSKLEEELEEENKPVINMAMDDEDNDLDRVDLSTIGKRTDKVENQNSEPLDQRDFILEDDVLNVPAFFRRKK